MNVKHRRSGKDHFSVQEELVEGELQATIFSHQVEDRAISCWCYVTAGMRRYRQREIAFTLVRQPGEKWEEFPRQPLDFFRQMYRKAQNGFLALMGEVVELKDEELLGFPALGYLDTPGAGGLAMIGLTAEELECVNEFGPQRMFSLLGKAEKFYPTPYWTERSRRSRVKMEKMKASVLHGVARVHESGYSVFREGSRVVILAREGKRAKAAAWELNKVPRGEPMAILTDMHPDCDGILKWEPGQSIPAASSATGGKAKRICGSFVVLRPNQPEDSARILEDGYVLTLTPPNWEQMWDAIIHQTDLSLPTCELKFIQEEIFPPRSWRKRVLVKEGQGEEYIIGRMEPKDFTAILFDVECAVQEVFRGDFSIGELRIVVEMEPKTAPRYRLEHKGMLEEVTMKRLWRELAVLPSGHVREPVSFMMEFEIGERKEAAAG